MELSEYILNFLNLKDVKYGGYILLFGVMIYFLQKSNRLGDGKKVGILNIIVFLLCFFNILDTFYVLLVYLVVMFINFIILRPRMFKEGYFKHLSMFMVEFLFIIFVDYGFHYLFLSLILGADYFRLMLPSSWLTIYMWITLFFGGYYVIRSTICCVNKNDFNYKNLKVLFDYIINEYDYSSFDLLLEPRFCDFCNILVGREDNSYFSRKYSYNWFSISFIWYRIKRFFLYPFKKKVCHIRFVRLFAYFILLLWHFIYIIFRTIDDIRELFEIISNYIYRCIKYNDSPDFIRKIFNRGYSTIEMQLIRTLAIDSDVYKIYPVKRKLFELCYSYIFFNCLKEYYIGKYRDYSWYKFKCFLIFLYMNNAKSMIGKREYILIDAFKKKKIIDVSYEQYLIWIYGLSHCCCSWIIENSNYIEWYKLDLNVIRKELSKFET